MTRAQKETGLKELAERADRGEPRELESPPVQPHVAAMQSFIETVGDAATKEEILARLAHERQSRNGFGKALGEIFETGPTIAVNHFCEAALSLERSSDFEAEAEAILSLDPRGELQLMLAVQLRGLHKAAMRELRSGSSEDTREARDSRCNRATKYSQAWRCGAELYSRLKGQIQQRFTVEQRFTVQDGGQAIVAASVGGGGREAK